MYHGNIVSLFTLDTFRLEVSRDSSYFMFKEKDLNEPRISGDLGKSTIKGVIERAVGHYLDKIIKIFNSIKIQIIKYE